MSATNRGAQRQPDDFYQTPKWAVKRLLEKIHGWMAILPRDVSNQLWMDPCSGAGNIAKACNEYLHESPTWILNDIVRRSPGITAITYESDFLTADFNKVDTIITNPPYILAEEFINKSLDTADTVIMLLRLNFLGSAKRQRFFKKGKLPYILVLPNRPIFGFNKKGKLGTDATEYAWYFWQNSTAFELNWSGMYGFLDVTPQTELAEAKQYLENFKLETQSVV